LNKGHIYAKIKNSHECNRLMAMGLNNNFGIVPSMYECMSHVICLQVPFGELEKSVVVPDFSKEHLIKQLRGEKVKFFKDISGWFWPLAFVAKIYSNKHIDRIYLDYQEHIVRSAKEYQRKYINSTNY